MDSHGFASTLSALWPALLITASSGIIRALWIRHRATQASQWPSTSGEVVHSHIHRGKAWNDVGHGNGPPLIFFQGRIQYAYRVNGRRYEASRLQFGATRRLYKRTEAAVLVAAYPVGRTLNVRYNPDRPSEAVLVTGVPPLLDRVQGYCVAALALALGMAIASGVMS